MSVINQMLVELDRRRASGDERNRIPDHVRALPDDMEGSRRTLFWLLGCGVLAALLLAAAAWWWQAGRAVTPVAPMPAPEAQAAAPLPALTLEPRETEFIARRLTLDLARAPENVSPPPPVAAAPEVLPAPAIETAALIAPRVAVPAQPRPDAVAEKPRTPAPVVKKTAEASPVPPTAVEIDKQVRQPTPRQRAEAEYSKGAVALHRGQPGEARTAFEAALLADPLHLGARQALVGVLLDDRQPAAAMRVLKDGLQLAPAQQGFAMTLARLQVENGELDAGVQTLARSLEYPGVSPDYIAFYAGLLQRQQKHAEAVLQFQRALQRRANVGVWLLGLGVSLEAMGRVADAQEAYRRAKSSGNLSPELQGFADQKLR